MTEQKRVLKDSQRWLLRALGILSALGVFAVDIALPHGYDIAYVYAIAVLVSGFSGRAKVVIGTTVAVWALTGIAFAVKEHESWHGIAAAEIFSRIMAIVITAITAIVVIAVIRSQRENYELARALRLAKGSREADARMLAAASEIAAIGTWSIDPDDDCFDWSENVAAMHGVEPGSRPTREQILSRLIPEDASLMRAALALAWDDGTPFRQEVKLDLPDGTQRWITIMGETTRHEDGSSALLHGTVQDITRWKETELSESALRHRLAQLTDSLPIIVWTATPTGGIEYFNNALLEYTGASPDSLLADQWTSAVDPRDLDRTVALWAESIATGKTYDTEYRVRGADGTFRWHHLTAKPERDEAGNIVRWWGSSVDIDANLRLRAEADAVAAEREVILESMSEGVYALDHESRVVYVNASAGRILDLDHQALLGNRLWDVYPSLKGGELERFLTATHESGKPARLTYRAVLSDKWLELSATPTSTGLTVFFHDITDVRRLSEHLAQSQRLEAVGQLTGGIAHDFNNLLTVVLGGSDALLADETLNADSREMATLIGSAAERGAELTHRLLAFARKQPLEPRAVDIAERLTILEPLLRRTLGEHITVSMVNDHSTVAEVDPGQFENALLNLAINARDAMPDGGALSIEVAETTFDEAYMTAHAEVVPGTYVVVTVSDSGVGIDADDLGNLFDPFFTTKETGKGSGLGLAMVWGFVKQSGGYITVYSEPGYGTSFKLYLPHATTAPHPQRPHSGQISTERGAGTILLAEDDDLVRAFATERLRAKGYDVVATASGPDALVALASMPAVDLLFTDVIMPGGMTGRQLADAVLELRPETPVLYASGYTENVIVHNDRLDAGVKLLAKPYSTKQLIERVGELINSTGGIAP